MTQPPTRGFSADEIKQRWRLLQQQMQAEHIDIMMLNEEPHVRYVSGFLTPFWQSPTRTWTILLPATGEPVAVVATIGEPLMRTTPIEHIVSYSSPHPPTHARETLVDTLQAMASALNSERPVRLGVPMGPETALRMPLQDWNWFKDQCARYEVVDATSVIQRVMQIKSAHEISIIRYVAQCASSVFSKLPSLLNVGMSEIEVFQLFKQCALSAGVDDVSFLVGGADHDGYRDIIGPPSQRELAPGDVLILDTGCTRDGYYCDFDRNYSVGIPSARVAEAHHVAWDATEAGLQALKPGEPFCNVFAAMQSVMQPYSDKSATGDVGRLGHGLGSQLTETPSFTAHETALLKPGMVITLEPGYCYGDGQVMVHEENVVITETGYELLSQRAPRDIMSI